jgi:hypothetical protein
VHDARPVRPKLDVIARPASADEREEMWPALTAAYPHFDAYQERTARAIPVVVLSLHR